MRRKAHARKSTGAKKSKMKTSGAKAKRKSPGKKLTPKMAAKSPRSRTRTSALDRAEEMGREHDGSLTTQPKMRISRKDSGEFRERQSSNSSANTVNPSTRR